MIDNRFENRPSSGDTGGELGGEVRGSSFFRGDVGVFGGFDIGSLLAWSVLVERNSDSYRREQRFGSLKDQSQLNFGLAGALIR